MFEETKSYLERKKAGMALLCMNIAKELENDAKSTAKWTDRTTNARNGIEGSSYGSGDDYIIELGYKVKYGGILEEGSNPHDITAKNSKYLYWKGADHPVKKVHHPGTKGFNTLHNTFNNNRSKINDAVQEYWSE